MKKIFQIAFLILFVIVILKKDKIKRYFVEQRYYSHLLNHHIIKHCYSPYPDLLKVFLQEGFDYYKYDQKITSDSLKKLQNININLEAAPKIPTILHKIHFTYQDLEKEIDPFYLEELKFNFDNFNKLGSTWKYIIWTNEPELFSKISDIKNLEIRSVEEFENHPYYEMLDDMVSRGEKVKSYLGKASNLLRLMALQKFGGIYSDNDAEIYKPEALVELIKKFDFIGVRETINKESYYANSFIASSANHPIIKDTLEISMRNYHFNLKDPNIPEYLKYPCTLHDKMIMSGSALLTISYFAKNNIDGNSDIILPSWMMMNQEFARLRNNNCKLSEITSESFNATSIKLPLLLEEFTNNSKWKNAQYNCNADNPDLQNIYYNMKYCKSFDIIGADPYCTDWGSESYDKKYLYFNYPWQWSVMPDKNQLGTNQTCQ